MFGPGGFAYVYLCYGLHHLLNFVTGKEGSPEAVLIRGVWITEGMEIVVARRRGRAQREWASGPGIVTAALGITVQEDQGRDLTGNRLWVEETPYCVKSSDIEASPRIGIGYAQEWALKPWRFVWKKGAEGRF